MSSRFDFSWDEIPNDGASTPVSLFTPNDNSENDELFQAWCQERHESIELKLYLDEALQLLKRLLADGEVTPGSGKRARHLLRTIEAAQRRGEPGGPA